MRTSHRASLLVVVGMSAGVAPAPAQQPTDVKGSGDHPRISRFAGSAILSYNAAEFSQLVRRRAGRRIGALNSSSGSRARC
jgi:hypothetical protein